MKRELNGITDHPTVHWTLCIYVRTNKISFCSLHQNFLHHGDTDAGLWKPRWKAQLSLWKTEVAVVGTHFCFYSSFCISTVQHAFPSSLLHGSGWHHVSDHQHAGVQKHTIHTTADIGNLCICSLGNTSIVWRTVVAMVVWVVLNSSFSSGNHFSSHLSFLGHCASLLDQLTYCVLVCVNMCSFGNVCMGADKATNSSS